MLADPGGPNGRAGPTDQDLRQIEREENELMRIAVRNALGIMELTETVNALIMQSNQLRQVVIELEQRTRLFVKDEKCKTVN